MVLRIIDGILDLSEYRGMDRGPGGQRTVDATQEQKKVGEVGQKMAKVNE